jgi:hypothetical protein
MERYLKQLKKIWVAYGYPPIFFCGDLFDRWNAPAELINWCMEHLPQMYGIPGQHDLPYHRFEDVKRTAFYTLVKSGKIKLVDEKGYLITDRKDPIKVFGFPWGQEIKTPEKVEGDPCVYVALVHAYCWTGDKCYPGAPPEQKVEEWAMKLEGFDFGLFGDNHKGFTWSGMKMNQPPEGIEYIRIVNNGSFLRRKADEINYTPAVHILYKHRNPFPVFLDVAKDQFSTNHLINQTSKMDTSAFMSDLMQMEDAAINFEETLTRYLENENVGPAIRQIIMRAMES